MKTTVLTMRVIACSLKRRAGHDDEVEVMLEPHAELYGEAMAVRVPLSAGVEIGQALYVTVSETVAVNS